MKIYKLIISLLFFSLLQWSCNTEKDYEHFPEGGTSSGEELPETPDLPSATIAFADTTITVLKNTGKIELPLVISEKLEKPTQVSVKITNTEGGVAGTDFMVPDDFATIEKDTLKGCVNVILTDDGKINEDWNFTVELVQVSGTPAPARIGNASRCHVQVSSNTFVSFDKVELTTSEKTNQIEALEIPLKVIGELKESVTIKVASKTLELANAAQEGVNFEIETPEITLEAGSTTGIIRIKTLNDHQVNGTGIAEIEISEVSGGNTIIGRANQRCRINIEDDNYSIGFLHSSITRDEFEGAFDLTVIASENVKKATTITIQNIDGTAIAGTNYTIPTSTITLAEGSNKNTFSVNIIPDHIFTVIPLTFSLQLAACDDEWAVLTNSTCEVTETSDPQWSASQTYSFEEDSGEQTLTIHLGHPAECDLTLGFSSSGATAGTNYDISTVVIPQGATTHSFPLTMKANPLAAPPTFSLKVNTINQISLPTPVTIATITTLPCTYRKLYGTYKLTSTYDITYCDNITVSAGITPEEIQANFNKKLVCKGKLVEGNDCTWYIEYNPENLNSGVILHERLFEKTINFTEGPNHVELAIYTKNTVERIPVTYNEALTTITWNTSDFIGVQLEENPGKYWHFLQNVVMTKQ